MKEQLDRAYTLIREGQTAEAITIIEAVIRENPENDAAWWLLANASFEPDVKRNALNNVMRLSSNPERRAKAAEALQNLERDPYSFDKAPSNPARPLKANNGCGRFVLFGLGILGLLACFACVGFYYIALPVFEIPSDYDYMGVLEAGTNAEGVLETGQVRAYQVNLQAGQRIRITSRPASVDSTPPFLILFTQEGELVASSTDGNIDYIRIEELIAETGDYLLIVRSFLGIGGGAYELEFEIIE